MLLLATPPGTASIAQGEGAWAASYEHRTDASSVRAFIGRER